MAVSPAWTITPAGSLSAWGCPRRGRGRQLSDLTGATATGAVHLDDPTAAHRSVADDGDVLLYRAYRDILPSRSRIRAGRRGGPDTGRWYSDLVIYQPGRLPAPSVELVRSIGHWNTPDQLEVFQCLTGQVLTLTAHRGPAGRPVIRHQLCGPGDLAVVPPAGWHLTAVLDGPAAVFNTYTDLHHDGVTPDGHSSRDAAGDDTLKYRGARAPRVAAVRIGDEVWLRGPDLDRPRRIARLPVTGPAGLRGLDLIELFRQGSNADLLRLVDAAQQHHRAPSQPGEPT